MLRKLEPGIEPTRKAAPDPEQAGYRVDDLVIDVRRQRVTRDGQPLGLSPLSFELLLALLRAAPGLVSLDQLMRSVWPGVVVSPETVSQRVKLVRNALGDDAAAPRYIAGVRGRGYRVIAPVSSLDGVDAPVAQEAAPSPDARDGAHAPAAATEDVPAATNSSSRPRDGKRRLPRWAALATSVVLAAGTLIYATGSGSLDSSPGSAPPAAAMARARNTLAVLPFANLSGDATSRSFGDGLSEEILHRLSRSGGLRVLARTSSFAYRSSGLDARTLQALLGVRYLLEGSIRREGRELRVTVQLVDESGFRVWSGSWHRKASGEFATQDEIAAAVAASVETRVAGAPGAEVSRGVAATGKRSGGDRLEYGGGRRGGGHIGRNRPAFR